MADPSTARKCDKSIALRCRNEGKMNHKQIHKEARNKRETLMVMLKIPAELPRGLSLLVVNRVARRKKNRRQATTKKIISEVVAAEASSGACSSFRD